MCAAASTRRRSDRVLKADKDSYFVDRETDSIIPTVQDVLRNHTCNTNTDQ